ncbi:MAG: hypothetical protein ACOH18_01245 [Candidatus Saccharimonadaceae bacterium]
MNKDVIYIDVDDDVTAIIGKIKKAKEKIVALVPPKRAGALQSAVNLRLLERMAKNDKKQLVLITNNQALVALAASAKIPVAKNLQSKPELAEVAAIVVDDGDDIIDGSQLPVGDHANTVKIKDGTKVAAVASGVRSEAIDTADLNIDGDDFAASSAGAKAAAKKGKTGPKIPNFDSFRKKLFFGIAGGVALVVLLIWMFAIAPSAKVIITASTTPQAVSASIKLGGVAATDYKTGVVSSVAQQEVKNETVEFDATGQKDLGVQATGTVRFSTSSFAGLGTIPAGTKLTSSSGLVFVTDQAVTLSYQPGASSASGTTPVTAAASGEKYNGASGSLSGAPSGVSASFVGASAGGTTNVVKVVSADDIERAQGQLIGQSTDDEKAALSKKFINGEIIVDGSFTVERAGTTSAPAVDQEAPTGKATLTIPTTYTIQAVLKTELDKYLEASLESSIDTNAQKIYGTGISGATLGNFSKNGDTTLATVNANGSVGPKINEDDIKNQVKGKRYGEVQQKLEAINGIKQVDVQFSYFWVQTVPNNLDKIKIEFKVQDE